MKDVGIVHGSKVQAVPIIINGDIVYIHKNIKKLESEDGADIYEYHEYQYSRDEYLSVMTQQNEEIMLAIAELGSMVAGGVDG